MKGGWTLEEMMVIISDEDQAWATSCVTIPLYLTDDGLQLLNGHMENGILSSQQIGSTSFKLHSSLPRCNLLPSECVHHLA